MEKDTNIVKCSFCGSTYSIANIKVITHIVDIEKGMGEITFKTPCCGKIASDDPWKEPLDFVYIHEQEV